MKARHRSALAPSGRQPLPPERRPRAAWPGLQLRRPPRWEGRRRAGRRRRRRQRRPLEHRPAHTKGKAFLAARIHPLGLGPPAPRRWSIGNAARRLRMVRERRPWERRSRQSFRGGETGAGRCRERSPGSLGGETPDFFTWVGRAAHGGHAARTLSREGDAATVTRRRTDRPQWCQVAGMNGSDLEKNRDRSEARRSARGHNKGRCGDTHRSASRRCSR